MEKETIAKDFEVVNKFNTEWNRHYNFDDPKNKAEIERMARYDEAFNAVYGPHAPDDENVREKAFSHLKQAERDQLGGKEGYDIGVVVGSDWGINKVTGVSKDDGEEVVTKEITVFPNNMLSLQSHLGRQEVWEVRQGTLSLIMDADLYEVSNRGVFKVTRGVREEITDPKIAQKNGEHWSIILPKGSIHCMINRSDEDVIVVETQRGICREADNRRYADQLRNKTAPRATLPLTSEILAQSAALYWNVEKEIATKPGVGWKVSYDPNLPTHQL